MERGGGVALGVVTGVALVWGGCVAVVRSLDFDFNAGRDVGEDCRHAESRVVRGAAAGDTEVVTRELRHHVDLNREDRGHLTALRCAAEAGDLVMVRLLVEHGATATARALHAATGANTEDLVSGRAADLDRREPIVRFLLDQGADPDAGPEGPSPLLYAAWRGDPAMVDLLLAHHADPDHGGRLDSIVVTAVATGLDQILRGSGPSGATVTTVRPDLVPQPVGNTVDNVPPLLAAAWTGRRDIATKLLAAGADPNLLADRAYTPLLAAAVRGDRNMVQLLLAHHASPRPPVRPGVPTPGEAASRTGHPDVAELLGYRVGGASVSTTVSER
jgi:ankyrin repeat protein